MPQKFAIGGAPISQSFADEIGADGYGADASSAVDLFLYFVGKGPPPKAKSKQQAIDEVKAEREESRAQRDREREIKISNPLLAGHPVRGESVGRFRRGESQPAGNDSPTALTPRRKSRD